MKYYRLIPFIGIFVLLCLSANAQEQLQRRDNNKRPVLIDDRGLLNLDINKQQYHFHDIPVSNISVEQGEQLQALQTEKQKKLNQLSFLLAEKRAQQQTLEARDKPDMKAINKLIDKQATLMGSGLKIEAEYKQKIRAILTDEQRVEFDAKASLK